MIKCKRIIDKTMANTMHTISFNQFSRRFLTNFTVVCSTLKTQTNDDVVLWLKQLLEGHGRSDEPDTSQPATVF